MLPTMASDVVVRKEGSWDNPLNFILSEMCAKFFHQKCKIWALLPVLVIFSGTIEILSSGNFLSKIGSCLSEI